MSASQQAAVFVVNYAGFGLSQGLFQLGQCFQCWGHINYLDNLIENELLHFYKLRHIEVYYFL